MRPVRAISCFSPAKATKTIRFWRTKHCPGMIAVWRNSNYVNADSIRRAHVSKSPARGLAPSAQTSRRGSSAKVPSVVSVGLKRAIGKRWKEEPANR